jgi:DnaJ-class molecular chaperone
VLDETKLQSPMSDQTPYEKLGVAESASFEEIQSTRDRLLREYAGDVKKCSEVEASYDKSSGWYSVRRKDSIVPS